MASEDDYNAIIADKAAELQQQPSGDLLRSLIDYHIANPDSEDEFAQGGRNVLEAMYGNGMGGHELSNHVALAKKLQVKIAQENLDLSNRPKPSLSGTIRAVINMLKGSSTQ